MCISCSHLLLIKEESFRPVDVIQSLSSVCRRRAALHAGITFHFLHSYVFSLQLLLHVFLLFAWFCVCLLVSCTSSTNSFNPPHVFFDASGHPVGSIWLGPGTSGSPTQPCCLGMEMGSLLGPQGFLLLVTEAWSLIPEPQAFFFICSPVLEQLPVTSGKRVCGLLISHHLVDLKMLSRFPQLIIWYRFLNCNNFFFSCGRHLFMVLLSPLWYKFPGHFHLELLYMTYFRPLSGSLYPVL